MESECLRLFKQIHFSRWSTKFIQHYITFIRVSFKHACIKSRYLNIMQSTWPLCELERTPTKARNTDALWIDSNFFTTKIIAQIDNPLKGLKSLAFCRKNGWSCNIKASDKMCAENATKNTQKTHNIVQAICLISQKI